MDKESLLSSNGIILPHFYIEKKTGLVRYIKKRYASAFYMEQIIGLQRYSKYSIAFQTFNQFFSGKIFGKL